MFTIDINFLRDRQSTEGAGDSQPIADAQWLIGGGIVAGVLLLGSLGAYLFLNNRNTQLQSEVQTLTVSEQDLDKKLETIKQSELIITTTDQQTSKLVQLFVGDIPASAILQDIRERTPLNVKIESVSQLGKKVTLLGQAAATSNKDSAFDQVNDFMLKLQESPYLADKGVELKTAKLAPARKDAKVDIAIYQVDLTLTPNTTLALQKDLQQSQSEGILSRIAVLKEKGIDPNQIQPQVEGGQK